MILKSCWSNICRLVYSLEVKRSTRRYISSTTTSIMSLHQATANVETFHKHLQFSHRILALCGAGLSAASGLPTFRGAGGLWRSYDATELATPEAFGHDPALVWQFYSYRRHMALAVKPNAAHYALAKLARRNQHFLTLTQNVDGASNAPCKIE